MTLLSLKLPALVAAILLAGCAYHIAAISTPVQPAADPPSRVARLSYLSGTVFFNPAGTDEWTPAVLNRPLTAGDHVWTDTDGRAELHIGTAAVRMSSRTSAGVLNLDDRTLKVKLSEGTLGLRVGRLDEEDTIEVDTPEAAISALRTGDYRIEVAPDSGETMLTVWSGQLDAVAPGQAFTVRPGQRARVYGAGGVRYEISAAPGRDGFDQFCQDRDRREERAPSLKYVSPAVIGWDDLDGYGYWQVHASYGPMWIPRGVAPGWAPYRFGRWVWIEPWGWTWIDDAPWGFAPFHYGRWIFIGGNWCWVPGPMRIRPIYAPALVVFIGGGPGLHHYFRVGVGIGVAWFPLGPREVYIPPYRASRIYVANVNVSNTTRVIHTDVSKQRYVNRTVQGAVTAVPEETFTSGRLVSQSAIRVAVVASRAGGLPNRCPVHAAAAHSGGMAPPVIPTRRSLAPAAETRTRPPEATVRPPVVVRRTPARSARTLEYRQVRPPTAEQARPPATGGEVRPDRGVRDQERRRRAIEKERNGANQPRRRKDYLNWSVLI